MVLIDRPGGYAAGCSKQVVSKIDQLRATQFRYDNEFKALSNACDEELRRFQVCDDERDEERLQRTLSSAQCPEWAKRLLREQRMKKIWGFAKFVDPQAVDAYDMEEYHLRDEGLLSWGQGGAGHLETVGQNFTLDLPEWPQELPGSEEKFLDDDAEYLKDDGSLGEPEGRDENDNEEDDGDAPEVGLEDERLRRIDEQDIAKMGDDEYGDGQHDGSARNSAPNENVEWIEGENDEGLRAKFQMLRLCFRSIRERGALDEGTLSNVFIVVDAACAFSLFEALDADSVWVWAVAPDYKEPLASEGTSATLQHRYRGFLRVRLQQLVDKFSKCVSTTKKSILWLHCEEQYKGV